MDREPAQNYVSQPVLQLMRKQARWVWGGFLLLALLWVLVIVVAPLLLSAGLTSISDPIYKFCSYICHQFADRSLHLAGHPLAVCSRCFGVYAGILLGFVAYPVWRDVDNIEPFPRIWLFLSMVPIGIDWSLTVFGIWENNHFSRTLTGAILGFACATYIIPALVEIFRYRALKNHRT